ncbi:MAG: NYN domain-containing protein [Candidatus Pacebacteria bacterium]|nr:NYN domain-containing protein [Candidatus Paceibacterota bacterium]
MKEQNLRQRIGVFVDVSNLYHSAKNLYGAYVNFGQVLKDVVNGRDLVRAIAYVIQADIEQEQPFFEALKKAGFEVKAKDLQVFAGGAKKGDWDVGLALDSIKIASHLDVVVLVSGDGDFIPLVSYLKENKGCKVELASFGKTTSNRLVEMADSFLDLDSKLRTYLIQRPGVSRARRRV